VRLQNFSRNRRYESGPRYDSELGRCIKQHYVVTVSLLRPRAWLSRVKTSPGFGASSGLSGARVVIGGAVVVVARPLAMSTGVRLDILDCALRLPCWEVVGRAGELANRRLDSLDREGAGGLDCSNLLCMTGWPRGFHFPDSSEFCIGSTGYPAEVGFEKFCSSFVLSRDLR
jgi:hypothetical protein